MMLLVTDFLPVALEDEVWLDRRTRKLMDREGMEMEDFWRLHRGIECLILVCV